MSKNIFLSIAAIIMLMTACEQNPTIENDSQLSEGSWLFKMQLNKVVLPFELEILQKDSSFHLTISNAEERIHIKEAVVRNDSLIFQMPVFESAFYLNILDSNHLSGEWVNYYKGDDYKIHVTAEKTETARFADLTSEKSTPSQVFPKYEVSFSPGEESESKAIGLFKQSQNRLSGTFATETGDYRYLEGVVSGDSIYLSTFDGSHAYYFEAVISDSSLRGVFYSGTHFEENWTARVNPNFELRNPDSLTFSSDSSIASFHLENELGELVQLEDEQFNGKVKLIQIMGSWCPNCLDESLYFKELKEQYKNEPFEIIAIAFERTRGKEKAIGNIKRLKEQKGLNYPILLGGFNRDHHPTDLFSSLNHIMSYPTTIYLDKQNRIRKIYTGFYGPGTGNLHTAYQIETEAFIESLLSEN